MFTGIIENTAILEEKNISQTNVSFIFKSPITSELKVDQSVSHNGVCLTIEKIWAEKGTYQVTAIEETLKKTSLGTLKVGDKVNQERCLKADGRFDGHIVQGHVDQTGTCKAIEDQDGSWLITIAYDPAKENLTVEKGSICLNGISLTVVNSKDAEFSVAIIPYTWEFTNLHSLKVGDSVNLEFDILGKYIKKILGRTLPA
ncbi:riboflavin synthase [Lacihabitans lacunae]|uniref:Riboflavin synthase n=1 Tax=Lacihabitans lacunae TaxID=1028214 RepID=A0ABV7YS85_9BACT